MRPYHQQDSLDFIKNVNELKVLMSVWMGVGVLISVVGYSFISFSVVGSNFRYLSVVGKSQLIIKNTC